MKNSLRCWLSILTILIGFSKVHGQSYITIEASQNVTNFLFTYSDGSKDRAYEPNYSGGYAVGYRYNWDNGLYIPVKLGMRKSGANWLDNTYLNFWDLRYAEGRLGVGYKYDFNRFGIHLAVQGYYAYLLRAHQLRYNENINPKKSGDINVHDYGVFFSPGVNFRINDYMEINFDLNYMWGLADLDHISNQKSTNQLFGATIGMAFAIK